MSEWTVVCKFDVILKYQVHENGTDWPLKKKKKLFAVLRDKINLFLEFHSKTTEIVKEDLHCFVRSIMSVFLRIADYRILLTLSNFLGDCDLAFDAFLHSMGALCLNKDKHKLCDFYKYNHGLHIQTF